MEASRHQVKCVPTTKLVKTYPSVLALLQMVDFVLMTILSTLKVHDLRIGNSRNDSQWILESSNIVIDRSI